MTEHFTTELFGSALAFAHSTHRKQSLKGLVAIPFICHPLAVASLVLEAGGTETEAIAGLLHDSIEQNAIDLPEFVASMIRVGFGDEVLEIVEALTENPTLEPRYRKAAYIESVRMGSNSVALVSCADKLHNIKTYLNHPHLINVGLVEFYYELCGVFMTKLGTKHPLVSEFQRLMPSLELQATRARYLPSSNN